MQISETLTSLSVLFGIVTILVTNSSKQILKILEKELPAKSLIEERRKDKKNILIIFSIHALPSISILFAITLIMRPNFIYNIGNCILSYNNVDFYISIYQMLFLIILYFLITFSFLIIKLIIKYISLK